MASKSKFQAIRGTRDLLPPETALWNRVEQTAHEVLRTFGFGEIRPPIFESTEVFARAVGDDTDIVSKEMYRIPDRPDDLEPLESIADGQRYIADLKRRMENGNIPNDSRNQEALARYSAALRELNNFLSNPASESKNSDQKRDVERARDLVFAFMALGGAIQLGPELSLRPEATASVCRAYIEHNMQQLPQPVKLYYLGPMFRRERPQKGRYRQFYQIGAEVLGGPDAPGIDAEVIEMVMTFFDRLQVEDAELSINSIGHAADNCRRAYVLKLKAALEEVRGRLGEDSKRRIDTNPLRVLDSKLEHEQPIIAKLPKIADHLCDDCKSHYAAVKRELDLRGVLYKENWRLVRGLDYYMRTTFEITARGLGSQNAVCGGGRYDGLVELLGGPPTKGIGFAIGEDRLILSLEESGKKVASGERRVASADRGVEVYVAWMGQAVYAAAIRAAKNLRAAGISVELPPAEQKFGKALERADKLAARFALILGDNEVQTGEWTLKTLATGDQVKIAESDLLAHLRKQQ
jgi:histidyl-tRNA synthetase